MPPAELGRSALAQSLVVDDHDAVRHPHLVGMPTLRQIDGRELAGVARIGHVHDRGAARPVHVPDKERRALDPNLPSARAVEVRYEGGVRSTGHETLDKVTFVGAGCRRYAAGPGALDSGDFYDAAGGVATPLLEQVEAFQCRLIAGDEQDGGLPVVAVNVLEPGAARHR